MKKILRQTPLLIHLMNCLLHTMFYMIYMIQYIHHDFNRFRKERVYGVCKIVNNLEPVPLVRKSAVQASAFLVVGGWWGWHYGTTNAIHIIHRNMQIERIPAWYI